MQPAYLYPCKSSCYPLHLSPPGDAVAHGADARRGLSPLAGQLCGQGGASRLRRETDGRETDGEPETIGKELFVPFGWPFALAWMV